MPRSYNNQKNQPANHSDDSPSPFFNNGFCRGKKTRHGYMLFNSNDFVGTMLEKYGEWAYSEIILLSKLVKPGNVVVDVGANIGTHTLSLANLIQPDGFLFSLEPQRISFEFLCANIILNNLTNVFPIHAGASDKPGEILVPVVDPTITSNAAALGIEGHSFGDTVSLITLDSLNLARCNLIKIDVEGMELKVIEGARQTIMKHRPVIFTENNISENSEKMIKNLKEMNYSLWWFISGYPDNAYMPDFDMLCLPAEWKVNVEALQPVLDEKDTGPLAYARAKSQDDSPT